MSKSDIMLKITFWTFLSTLMFIQDARTVPISSESEGSQLCLTENCANLATNILESMDRTVRPCDDFYAYACNGWIKKHPLRKGENMRLVMDERTHKNYEILKELLSQPIETFKSEAEQKAKRFYETCMNMKTEAVEVKSMLELIEKLGSWSVFNSNFTLNDNWSLQNTLEIVQNQYNVKALFSYDVRVHDKTTNRNIMHIIPSELKLEEINFQDTFVLESYLEYMTKVGILLGGDPTHTKSRMEAVLEFESKLTNVNLKKLNRDEDHNYIIAPMEIRREEMLFNNLETIKGLQEAAGFIDWSAFFQNALSKVGKRIALEEEIVVFGPEYFVHLSQLIKEYNASDEGRVILHDYLIWQTVQTYISHLSAEISAATRDLKRALNTLQENEESQWKMCAKKTDMYFKCATGAMFIRKTFENNTKSVVEKMFNEVREAFKGNFKNLDWIDPKTTNIVERKADAVEYMIGYPDSILEPKLLDECYKDLKIGNNYLENQLNVGNLNKNSNLETLIESVGKRSCPLFQTILMVNAAYFPLYNRVSVPAGIIQTPFYDLNRPASLNYGSIGIVLGHELTHGFDRKGRFIIRNNKTKKLFAERSECFVNQYNKYKAYGMHLNGTKTLGENIADNGGIKAAYHAYLENRKDEIESSPLPGIDLNHKQLFFLAFAQTWCSRTTEEGAKDYIYKNVHSLPRYRVIGTLSNFDEFSKEFNCPSESMMNPKEKCVLW